MNKAILMGRLTRDPLILTSSNEDVQLVVKFTLAINRIRSNNGKEDADFFNCIVFGTKAEFAQKFLKQGVKIAIVGHLQSGSYMNKDGMKVYTTDIIIEEIEFAENRSRKQAEENQSEEENIR
jgi:single-strand DNA-binding protein